MTVCSDQGRNDGRVTTVTTIALTVALVVTTFQPVALGDDGCHK